MHYTNISKISHIFTKISHCIKTTSIKCISLKSLSLKRKLSTCFACL